MSSMKKASGHTQYGNHVWDVPGAESAPVWRPGAIARMYDAKANFAYEAGTCAQDGDEPCPRTEAIDVRAIQPPAAPAAAPAPSVPATEALETAAAARRRQRSWRSWLLRRG
jgi:hypothetical protein